VHACFVSCLVLQITLRVCLVGGIGGVNENLQIGAYISVDFFVGKSFGGMKNGCLWMNSHQFIPCGRNGDLASRLELSFFY
jgi:hypothetical protein